MHRETKLKTLHLSQRNKFNALNRNTDKEELKNTKSLRKEDTLNMHFYNYQQKYEIMQENWRIVKRITNPKRDGIIQRSLETVPVVSKSSRSQHKNRSEHRKRNNMTVLSLRKGDTTGKKVRTE